MQRMFIRMLWRLALLVLPLGAAALLMPSVAAAAQPSCGDVVTSNVTLTGNLDCSSSNSDGLIVGKNGITINLAGFTIIGPSNGSYEGINNTGDYSGGPFAGWNNVTVENGKLTGWYDGVDYYATSGGKLEQVRANDNTQGIEFENSRNGVINHSRAIGNSDDGIRMDENHKVSVTNSRSNGNGGTGILDLNSLDTLSGDTANSNSQWGVFVNRPLTVNTPKGQVYYTIMNSTANNNDSDGFNIDQDGPVTIYQANVFGNTAKNNGGWGYYAEVQVKSNKTNGAMGNTAGACFHVKCHSI